MKELSANGKIDKEEAISKGRGTFSWVLKKGRGPKAVRSLTRVSAVEKRQ